MTHDSITNSHSAASLACNATAETLLDIYTQHIPAVLIISKVLLPFWVAVGSVGNILSLLVWLQSTMRHSSGFYLAALAVSDTFFLVFYLVYFINYNTSLLNRPYICQWFGISFMSVRFMSPLFVLAFTAERYLVVCQPLKVVNCQPLKVVNCYPHMHRKTFITIAGSVIFSFALGASYGYFIKSSPEHGCDVQPDMMSSSMWLRFTWSTEMIVFGIVPISILVLNCLLIHKIRHKPNILKESWHQKNVNRISACTLTLLGVSFYYILSTLFMTMAFILIYMYQPGHLQLNSCLTQFEIANDSSWQKHLRFTSFKILTEAICQSHYAINFFIYLLTGSKFRIELRRMIRTMFCKSRTQSQNTSSLSPT